MSEVMRWKLKGFIPGVDGMSKAVFQPTVVLAEDYDAAQAELAALREELAECITEMTLAITDYEIRRAMTAVGRTRFMEIIQKYNIKPTES